MADRRAAANHRRPERHRGRQDRKDDLQPKPKQENHDMVIGQSPPDIAWSGNLTHHPIAPVQ